MRACRLLLPVNNFIFNQLISSFPQTSQLEQDNSTLASLVDFLVRLVDLAVSPPRPALPESPSAFHTVSGSKVSRQSNEGGVASQAPALSLDVLQWEQMRVDQALVVHIAATSAKFTQFEASAVEAAALLRDALSKGNDLKQECSRLRLHGVCSQKQGHQHSKT
jgi:hypothetical protein